MSMPTPENGRDGGDRDRTRPISPGKVDDAFDLAAVDVEFARDGALAATSVVPGPDRLLQGWRGFKCCSRIVARDWYALALGHHRRLHGEFFLIGPDQCHEKLEGAGQRQGGPCADHGTDRAVAQAMCEVSSDGGHDSGSQAPVRPAVVPAGSRRAPACSRP